MHSKDEKNWRETLSQVPLDIKQATLPFDMPWNYFEDLCTMLAREEHNIENIEIESVMKYGRGGQNQEGIDVKAVIKHSSKFFVIQCKRYEEIRPQFIDKWIEKFIKGRLFDQTAIYVLATTFDVSSDTKLVDSWHKAQQKLNSVGIESYLWDKNTILTKLKNAYQITSQFWGEQIAARYCLSDLSENKYPHSYTIENINILNNFIHLENRTCHLTLMVPCREADISVGGILSFARRDLHGTTFSIDGKALVKLLQVKAHSKSLRYTDYLYKHGDKYYLSIQNIRLSLETNEVDDLDWILEKSFHLYMDASRAVESKFKVARFKRSNDHFKVKICEIKIALWNSVISYTYAHDVNKGVGPDFIFDSAPGCLKVFSDRDTDDLDFGYHVIIHPRPSDSMYNRNIILEWEPLSDIARRPVEINQRKAWDAEYTYQWLNSYLFPRVYDWAIKMDKQKVKWFNRIFTRNNDSYTPTLDYFVTGIDIPAAIPSKGIRIVDDLLAYTDKLQQHFNCYSHKASIPEELVVNVIDSCIFLLEKNTKMKCNYIKGNLGLGSSHVYKELLALKENKKSRIYATSSMLDMALRSLGKLLEVKHDLSQYEIDSLIKLLAPVIARYEEDRICELYY